MFVYSNPEREDEPHAIPDVEVYYEVDLEGGGWYWRACFPGCLPDSDPIGPFDTREEAIRDMRGEWGE